MFRWGLQKQGVGVGGCISASGCIRDRRSENQSGKFNLGLGFWLIICLRPPLNTVINGEKVEGMNCLPDTLQTDNNLEIRWNSLIL